MGMRGMRAARVHRPLEAAVHARAHKRPLADARVHVHELEPCMSAPGLGSRLPRTAEGPVGMRGMRTARVHRTRDASVHARARKRPLAYARVHVRELEPCTSAC